MNNKHFRLEDLRLYRIEGFADVRKIRQTIVKNGGCVILDSGVEPPKWIIYAAPHSLNQQFLDEIAAFEADKAELFVKYPQFAQAAANKACERRPPEKEFVVVHETALRTPGEVLYYAGIINPPLGVEFGARCALWSYDKSKAIRWSELGSAIHEIADKYSGQVAEVVSTQSPLESGPKPAP